LVQNSTFVYLIFTDVELGIPLKGRNINEDVQICRRILKLFKGEAADGWRKYDNEELHVSFCSFNIVGQTQSLLNGRGM
jgi:hypothetical protein